MSDQSAQTSFPAHLFWTSVPCIIDPEPHDAFVLVLCLLTGPSEFEVDFVKILPKFAVLYTTMLGHCSPSESLRKVSLASAALMISDASASAFTIDMKLRFSACKWLLPQLVVGKIAVEAKDEELPESARPNCSRVCCCDHWAISAGVPLSTHSQHVGPVTSHSCTLVCVPFLQWSLHRLLPLCNLS